MKRIHDRLQRVFQRRRLVFWYDATGTENRAKILSLACGGKGTAIQAEDFLELNTKTDGRALMRE